MVQLLERFSLSQIAFVVIALAFSVKGVVDFYEWAKTRVGKQVDEAIDQIEWRQEMQTRIDQLKEEQRKVQDRNILFVQQLYQQSMKYHQENIQQHKTYQEENKGLYGRFDNLDESIQILLQSDRDSIKAFIVAKHHYFFYQRGWIDDYSLDSIEKRFSTYTKLGGNSYVSILMDQLRTLPKKHPATLRRQDEQGNIIDQHQQKSSVPATLPEQY